MSPALAARAALACFAGLLALACEPGEPPASRPAEPAASCAPDPLPPPRPDDEVDEAPTPKPKPAWVHESSASAAACPSDMLLVEGSYCPFAGHRCAEWIDEQRDRCAVYAPPPICDGKRKPKRFCIDRYEYPNLEGVVPVVMVDWLEARAACEVEGKRLCTSSEWTLACEGDEILPYPYGYVRDKTLCNVDRPRPVPEPDFEAFSKPRRISAEVTRLDLRAASGEMSSCVSPYGAYDMTGNVDEWVVNEEHFDPPPPGKTAPYISGLKGGYWGPIRARCRPITPSHNEWFRFYQVGFRCCANPSGAPPAASLARTHVKKPTRAE